MDEGRWMLLADASKAFAVTVDALRHRIRKGELTHRRELAEARKGWLERLLEAMRR